MVNPFPLRIGGMRGPEGSTLDSIVEAINGLADAIAGASLSADILAELQTLNSNIGSTATTDCGLTNLEMLCSIWTLLGGESTAAQTPPVSCPGYAEVPVLAYKTGWYRPFSTYTGLYPNQYAQLTQVSPGGNVVVEQVYPDPSDDTLYFFRIRATENLANFCVSWQVDDGGYGLYMHKYLPGGGGTTTLTPLNTDQGTGVGSDTFSLDNGYVVEFYCHDITDAPIIDTPQASVWVKQGPFG